jgi:hypothetical protein
MSGRSGLKKILTNHLRPLSEWCRVVDMNKEMARTAWLTIKAQYEAAIAAWGWDDARTIELEDAEAEASDLYISLAA